MNNAPPGLLAAADQELAELNERIDLMIKGCQTVHEVHPTVATIELVALMANTFGEGDRKILGPLLAVAVERLFRQSHQ